MAKKQTRRSVSVRGDTYHRLREYCANRTISISDLIERLVAQELGYEMPEPTGRSRLAPRPQPSTSTAKVATVSAPKVAKAPPARIVKKAERQRQKLLAERAARAGGATSRPVPRDMPTVDEVEEVLAAGDAPSVEGRVVSAPGAFRGAGPDSPLRHYRLPFSQERKAEQRDAARFAPKPGADAPSSTREPAKCDVPKRGALELGDFPTPERH